MSHDARAIANLILDRFDAVQNEISNKKINKLLYFCHGFSLVRLGGDLIRNHVEAWKHGPVFRVVYEEFRQFEHRPIVGRASYFDVVTETQQLASYDRVSVPERELVYRVVSHFTKFTADELESITHKSDSPWSVVVNLSWDDKGIRNRIPNQLISDFFSSRYGIVGKTN